MNNGRANRIMFFLGAGASAPMGIPTMRKFSKDFVKYGEKTENRETIGYILRDLKRVTGSGAWDLEQLLLLIRQAKNIDSDVAVGLLRKRLFKGESQNKQKFDRDAHSIGDQFEMIERILLKYIRTRCLNPEMERAREIYSEILPISEEYILDIFTTNYDPILENVCTKLGYDYSDGFYPDTKIGAFKWDERCLSSTRVNIYKIHGSVTWYKKDNYVLKFPADISGAPSIDTVMVYPTELKEILNPPFSQIHRIFEKILFESDLCIVVGHSFQDNYIRNLFLDRIKEKKFKMYFIGGRFARSIKRRIFGTTNMVSPITKNFEDVDITSLINKHLK